jgi:hypothetical protein
MLSVVAGVLWLGGANMTVFDGDLFYQRSVDQTLGKSPVVRLGCVVADDLLIETAQVSSFQFIFFFKKCN